MSKVDHRNSVTINFYLLEIVLRSELLNDEHESSTQPAVLGYVW